MASSVSSADVVDRCCVADDASSGAEGVCKLPTGGHTRQRTHTALITFVCGVSVPVLSVALIVLLSLEVGDSGDDMS